MTSIGGIERVGVGSPWIRRVEQRVAEEGLRHLRLLVDPVAWHGDDGSLAAGLARIARCVTLVVACDVAPLRLVSRPGLLQRWAQLLAEHEGALELPADPPVGSIWEVPSPSAGLAAALVAAAGLVHEVGCAVAWSVTPQADLQTLARRGPQCDREPIMLDVTGCPADRIADAMRQTAACWPEVPVWLCAGQPQPPAAVPSDPAFGRTAVEPHGEATDEPTASVFPDEVDELERFTAATEHGADRVYWSGRPQAPLRSLWRRVGQRRATAVLTRRPAPVVGGTGTGPRALVTGGAGFVGCNLVARLRAQGRDVVILDNLGRPGVERNLEWLHGLPGGSLELVGGDVRSPTALQRALRGVDQVFHLAAQVAVTTSMQDPLHDFEVNAGGTLRLLEALRRQPSPPAVVLTSTNKVYGGLDDVELQEHERRYVPACPQLCARGIDETRPLDLQSPYGCSKGAADQYLLDYARSFDVPAVVLRMSCIYGPHQLGTEDQGWVAHFLRQAMEGRPITIFGDGKQVRDVLFVDDLIDALCRVGARARPLAGHAFNIGGGPANTLSLLELVDYLGALLGRTPTVQRGPWRRGDQRYYVSGTRQLAAAIEWAPQVGVEEGLRRLHRWLCDDLGRDHGDGGAWAPDESGLRARACETASDARMGPCAS